MVRRRLLEDALETQNKGLIDLARELGISKSSLYQRLNGRVLFRIDELQKIKDYLNLDISKFRDIFFSDM